MTAGARATETPPGHGGPVPGDPAPASPRERPRRRGVWVFLAAATAFVLVAPTCLQFWVRAIRQTATSVTPFKQAIREVRLDMGDAQVSVGPGADGEARVYKELRWALSRPVVTESVVDDVLYVTFRCGGEMECGGDIDVQVPRGARVSAVSGSGEINVRGLAGDLDLRTGSGEIRIAGTRGRLRVRAGSGTINATGLAAPKTQAQVSSGTVNLTYAEPPDLVEAVANSGTVKVIVPPGSHYRVSGWTGSGPSHLNRAVVDERSSQEISVRSGSGSTWVDYHDE